MPEITIPTKYGIREGGAFFGCNMRKSVDGGVIAGYNMIDIGHRVTSTQTARLSVIQKFIQREYTSTQSIVTIWGFGKYSKGDLWVYPYYADDIKQGIDLGATGGDNWNTTNEDAGASSALEVCNDNEIVYSGRKYVGKTITSTLDGALAIDATSIDVVDASSFPSAGQATIISNIYSECIEYTGKTANQLTGVTRNKYYTTARAWATGTEIVAFRNKWLTWTTGLGSAVKSPSVKWEDYIFVGRGYTVGGWKENDGSDFTQAMLTLPANYEIVDMTTVLTGAGTMVLIAANRENSGDIFIWNGVDTTWSRIIPCGENIKKIDSNFVALGSGLYQTDTYSLSLLGELPDDKNNPTQANFDVTGMSAQKKEVFCLAKPSPATGQRNRVGLWIFSLQDRDWSFIPVYGGDVYNRTTGNVFISSEWKILISTNYKNASVNRFHQGANWAYYQIVYNPNTAHTLKLQEIKLNLQTDIVNYWMETYDASNLDLDIIVRVYDFKRPFYQYTNLATASPDATHLVVDKTLGLPRVGDRVELLENGSNNNIASRPRNITAIATATNYTLTLDSALSETPTDSSQLVLLNPLKKVKTISLTSYKIDPKQLKMLVSGQPEFQKLMVEVEFRDRGVKTYTIMPQLNSIELRFSVLG